MPISNATVVPILIAARLVDLYTRRRVYAQRTDRQWQNQLNNGGDTVRLNQPNLVSVSDYTSGGAVTYGEADVTALGDLTLTKAKQFGVKLDDISAVQSISSVLESAVEQAGIALAEQVDADVRAAMLAEATEGPTVTLAHSATSFDADTFNIPLMHRLLDVAKMPQGGRWVIIGPYSAEFFRKYGLQNAVLNAPAVSPLQNGEIANFGQFTWYVASDENSGYDKDANTAEETWVFGNDSATAFIDQIRRVEPVRLESTFADAVRGLYTYGVKTHRPERLYTSVATITAIP